MTVNHKNMLIDVESLLKEKAYHIAQILKLTRQRETRIDPHKYKNWQRDHDEWTHSDQLQYFSKIKTHMEMIVVCQRQMTQTKASHDSKKEEMQEHELCPYWTQDQKVVDAKLQKELQKIQAALKDPEMKALQKILNRKIQSPQISYRAYVCRSTDPADINNTFVLPEPTLRTRFVYADNTEEPVKHGHIIHWQYSGDTINPFPIYEKHTELMLPVGVAVTDRNGFIVQSAQAQNDMEILFDPSGNSLVVTHDTSATDIDRIEQAYKTASEKEDIALYTRLTNPDPATCPVDRTVIEYRPPIEYKDKNREKNLSINDIADHVTGVEFHKYAAESFAEIEFLKRNDTPYIRGYAKFLKLQSRIKAPYRQILTNMVYHGFSSTRYKKIDDLQVFKEKKRYQKLNRVNQHYFLPSNDYGFMLYPIDRGPIATKNLDVLAQPQNGTQIAKKGKIKAIAETTENDYVTIAVHCPLPEWDRRLNEKLRHLLYAQKAFAIQLQPHDHNLKRIKLLKELFRCQADFSKDIDAEDRKKHREIATELDNIHDSILNKTKDKAGREDLRLDKAVNNIETAANALWDLLKSEALCRELAAYRHETMPNEQAEAETNGVLAPGPYMQAEPFWGHIFETLTKCYSALANTPIADNVFDSQIAPFLLKIANSVKDVAAAPGVIEFFKELTEEAKVFVDDEDEQNEMRPLGQRISIDIDNDIDEAILPAPEDHAAKQFNPLIEIPILYLKGAGGIFHATPGPPCLAESLLDSYYDNLFRMASRNAKKYQVFHIKLALGLFKAFGVIDKDMINDKEQFEQFKKAFHIFLRNHGRIGNVKNIKWDMVVAEYLKQIEASAEKKAQLERELEILKKKSGPKYRRRRRNIRKKLAGYDTNLQEMMEEAKQLFNGETKKSSPSDFHYKARSRLIYKSVMMTFNIMSVIETWGNLKKGQVESFEDGLLLISSISEAVLDTMWKGAIGFKLSINWCDKIKSVKNSWLQKTDKGDTPAAKDGALKSGGKTASKTAAKIEQFADKLGTALAMVGSMSAFIQSVKHFRDDEAGEGALKLIEASSAAVVTAGYIIKASAHYSAKKAGAGAFIVRHMLKANCVYAIVTVAQIAYWVYQMTQPEALKISREVWKTVEKSKYTYWVAMYGGIQQGIKKEDAPIQNFYFPIKSDPALREAFGAMRSKIKGVKFGYMSWHAVIPLYKAGFGKDFIHGTVISALNIATEKYLKSRSDAVPGIDHMIKNHQNQKSYSLTDSQKGFHDGEIKKYGQWAYRLKNQPGYRPMEAKTLIEFYRYLASEDGTEKKFDNGVSYQKVKEQLEEGTFEPDEYKPELLPAQKDYTGDNFAEIKKKLEAEKDISIELAISRWFPNIADSQTYLKAAE